MIPGEMTEQKACKLFTAENLSVSVFRITSTIHTHTERTTKISSSIRLLFRQNVRDSLSEKCFICIRMNASSTTSKVTHNICLIEIRTHSLSLCRVEAASEREQTKEFRRMRPQQNRLRFDSNIPSFIRQLSVVLQLPCFANAFYAKYAHEKKNSKTRDDKKCHRTTVIVATFSMSPRLRISFVWAAEYVYISYIAWRL